MLNLLDDELLEYTEVVLPTGEHLHVLPLTLGIVSKYQGMFIKLGDPKKIKTQEQAEKYQLGLCKVLADWLTRNKENHEITPNYINMNCNSKQFSCLMNGLAELIKGTEKK